MGNIVIKGAGLLLFSWGAAGILRAEAFRIATYNLENYNVTSRMTGDGYAMNAPKPEKEKEALRAVIRTMNADLLAVQEIGGPEFVEELRRDLAGEGLNYAYTVTLEGPDPHRRTAVFSKKPPAGISRRTRIETGFSIPSPKENVALVNRGLLGVTVTVAGRPVTIRIVHLKSRLTRDPRDPRAEKERAAEATAIRTLLVEDGFFRAGTLGLLAGDFNDGPNAATLTVFAKFNDRPFLTRLEAKDRAGELWTYRNDKKGFYDRSDYVLATPALAACVTRSRALDHPLTGRASDHRPVVIDLEIPASGVDVRPPGAEKSPR